MIIKPRALEPVGRCYEAQELFTLPSRSSYKNGVNDGALRMTYQRIAGVTLGLALAVTWSLIAYAETRSKEVLEKEYRAASFRAVARDSFPVLFNPTMGTVADVPWLKERWRQIHNNGIIYQGDAHRNVKHRG